MTRVAAETLRLDQLGTVAPGKSADFVVLNANPLEDIRNTSKINSVVLHGRLFDRNALDKLLSDVELEIRKENEKQTTR